MHPKADRGPKLAGPYQLGRAGSRRVEAGHDQHDAVVAGASGGNNGAVAGFGEDAGGDANTLGARGALDSDAGGGTHPPVVGGGDGEGGVCGHGREYLPSVSSTMADAAGVTVTDLLHTPVRKLGLNNLSVVDFGFNRNAPTIIPPPPPPQLGAGTHDSAAPPPGYEAITPASSNNAHSIGGRGLSRDAGGGGNALLGGGLAPCGFAGVEGAVGGAASGGFPSSAAEHARGDDRRGEYEERERSWQPAWQSEAAVRPCELQRFQAQHAASSWQREQALLVLSRQQALLLQLQQVQHSLLQSTLIVAPPAAGGGTSMHIPQQRLGIAYDDWRRWEWNIQQRCGQTDPQVFKMWLDSDGKQLIECSPGLQRWFTEKFGFAQADGTYLLSTAPPVTFPLIWAAMAFIHSDQGVFVEHSPACEPRQPGAFQFYFPTPVYICRHIYIYKRTYMHMYMYNFIYLYIHIYG